MPCLRVINQLLYKPAQALLHCMLLTCLLQTVNVEAQALDDTQSLDSTDGKPMAPPAIDGAMNLTAEQVITLILTTPNLVIIDARKRSEYIKGHIQGAVNLLNSQMDENTLAHYANDKNAALLFYCNGPRCMRSSDAVQKALAWGYRNIFWFRGGWSEWSEKRLPVVID